MMEAVLSKSSIFDQDTWDLEEMGLKPSTTHSFYYFNFVGINPAWLKIAIKKFIWLQSSTKGITTCRSYISKLKTFGNFLSEQDPNISSEAISRELIIKYIGYLTKKSFSHATRRLALIHLRTFHEFTIQENWLPWPSKPLVYASDLPKRPESVPRFIPESVISQMMDNLDQLPQYMQHLIIVLLETGRRISEICTLKIYCLEKDSEGDCFLQVEESKLKKSYLLPISKKCIDAIKAQQGLVLQNLFKNQDYLFPSRHRARTPHVTGHQIKTVLNKLATQCNITDDNGQVWNFQSHQFRHTVGTRMINSGVPQAIVQKYLGHESPDMTSRYAHIHDETLKEEFYKFQQRLVDITGKIHTASEQYKDENWLRHNVMAQSLPNGLCALPFPQQKCPHANACLTCTHFRTTEKHLEQHRAQLEQTNKIIKTAKENGWQRQLEMNIAVKKNLESVISSLEKK